MADPGLMKPHSVIGLAFLIFTAAGCGPASGGKISVRSQRDYDDWFNSTSAKLSPDDARILTTAQQEIKLELMAHGSASGPEAIGDAYFQKINGLTVHDMMVLGLNDRLARLKLEHDEAQRLLGDNSKIHARAGDDASAAYVAGRVQEDRQREEKSAAQLAATRADLDRINHNK
jgi:hypothetical protein